MGDWGVETKGLHELGTCQVTESLVGGGETGTPLEIPTSELCKFSSIPHH